MAVWHEDCYALTRTVTRDAKHARLRTHGSVSAGIRARPRTCAPIRPSEGEGGHARSHEHASEYARTSAPTRPHVSGHPSAAQRERRGVCLSAHRGRGVHGRASEGPVVYFHRVPDPPTIGDFTYIDSHHPCSSFYVHARGFSSDSSMG